MAQKTKDQTQGLSLSDTAMAHLYRGELGRSDRWRTRLDTTTNWGLTTTAAVISFGFANAASSHVPLIVGIWMVLTFLFLEARRYRYYDLWNRRLRLLEDGYWSPLLRHEPVDPDAMRELAHEMSRPHLQLSFLSAVSTRMNRVYGPLLLVLSMTWFVKVFAHPTAVKSFDEFMQRAHVGFVPGLLITIVMAVAFLVFVFLFIFSFVARQPMGELRPRPRTRKLAIGEAFLRPYPVRLRRRPRGSRPVAEPTAPH